MFANVDFNLHDSNNDGRVRLGEIVENSEHGLIHIFDVSGKVDAGLEASLTVDVPLFQIDEVYEIARVTLLDFELPRPPPEIPILATKIGSTLHLNMGPRAGDRQFGPLSDGDESFVVLPGSAPGVVLVQAFGLSQEFRNVTAIAGDGGNGSSSGGGGSWFLWVPGAALCGWWYVRWCV